MRRIVLTGGGTAGHVFPLAAIAREIREQYSDTEFLYIGTRAQMGNMANELMATEHIPVKHISTGKMRRYFSLQYFGDFFRVPLGIVQSLWHLLVFMPDGVFSKGGYASVPVVIVAWIYRIPVLTHESDAVPGWANRINGKFSHFIALSFIETKRYFRASKALMTGNPIQSAMREGNPKAIYTKWDLDPDWPTIFVIGGSQGARVLNQIVIKILPKILHRAQIIHVTGVTHFEGVREAVARAGFRTHGDKYIAVPFLSREDMANAYAAADVVISRAGANSIAEIAANANVSILVPIVRSANNHQYMNAFSVAKRGGAVVIEEMNLREHILIEKIEECLDNETLRTQLSQSVQQFYHPEAIKKIVAGVMQMLS